jgi:DNA polymerase I-like protein with 3'-5' exonuclease and polymerase domains
MENLLKLTSLDGHYHLDLKACGTKTGRYAGGGGGDVRLNVQGLARREKTLMSCLLPQAGNLICSVDLTSGEPTVTTHYSQDKNYFNACFGMVGKDPYYDENDLLQIDDIYLMGASVSPIGRQAVLDAFNDTYDGRTFAEQWKLDKDYITKKVLKKTREFHKTLILALGYGQKPKGMVSNAYDNGYVLSMKDAKLFHHQYWNILFPRLGRLEAALQARFRETGSLVNQFGFRMVPENERLCLNYMIQSSVSGVIKVLEEFFYSKASYALPVSVIHDELLFEIPAGLEQQAREDMAWATEQLNAQLRWTVNVRTGFVAGNNWYEAK